MNTIYLECNSGISGDMTVAALLDLGADERVLRDGLAGLDLDGYEIQTGRADKNGISAYDFNVILHIHDHTHEHDHAHAHDGDKNYAHGHASLSGAGHAHRGIREINAIIDGGKITDNAKRIAREIFAVVAAAESKIHGVPVDEVHFHEVGAVDSIVDIVGVAICFDNLGAARVICTPLTEGQGTVLCRHGRIPVPAPATLEIASAHKIPLVITDNEGEMVTPTGAAIVAAMASSFEKPGGLIFKRTGYGAGKRNYASTNVLRASIVEELAAPYGDCDEVVEIACNIDDMTGEQLAHACGLIMDAGALDCWLTPVIMKKGRPAQTLSLLAPPEREAEFTRLLFTHTSTIGVRKTLHTRSKMRRERKTVATAFGTLNVKESSIDGVCKTAVEYESAKTLSAQADVPLITVYRAGESAAENQK